MANCTTDLLKTNSPTSAKPICNKSTSSVLNLMIVTIVLHLHSAVYLNIHPGWCEKEAKCVPGAAQGTDCPGDCLAHWIFNKDHCTGKVKSGSFENIAPEATHLVDAVWANPKVQINNVETQFDDKKEDILVGKKSESKKITYLDSNGQIQVKENYQESPVYGEIHKNVPIGTKQTKEVIDMTTGDRLDLQELEKKTHGSD